MNTSYSIASIGFFHSVSNAKSQMDLNTFDRTQNAGKNDVIPDFINLKTISEPVKLVESYHLIGDFNPSRGFYSPTF